MFMSADAACEVTRIAGLRQPEAASRATSQKSQFVAATVRALPPLPLGLVRVSPSDPIVCRKILRGPKCNDSRSEVAAVRML